MNHTQGDPLLIQHLEEIHTLVRVVCGNVIVPCLCFIGFVANILNVLVLTRSWMSSSTNVYLTAVAVCDVFYLIVTFLFYLKAFQFIQSIQIYMYTVPFLRATANLFSNTTTWLTVCFTIERYIAVSSPILGRRFCTQQRARYAVTILFLVSFLLTFPDYLKDKVVFHTTSSNSFAGNFMNDTSVPNEGDLGYKICDLPTKKYLIDMGYDYINQILFVLVPLVLLIIFNSLLIRTVMKANKGRQSLVQQSTKNVSSPTELHPGMDSQKSSTMKRSIRGGPVVTTALKHSMQTAVELTSSISQTASKSAFFHPFSRRRPLFGEQKRITLMLITIVIAFVLLQLPSIVPTVVENLWKAKVLEFTQTRVLYIKIYSNVSNLLLVVNAAMNFVFYSLFSAKFRQTCYALFRECECVGGGNCHSRAGGWHPANHSSRDRNLVRSGTTKQRQSAPRVSIKQMNSVDEVNSKPTSAGSCNG